MIHDVTLNLWILASSLALIVGSIILIPKCCDIIQERFFNK